MAGCFLRMRILSLKALSKIVADDISIILLVSETIGLDISCESSARADDTREVSSVAFSEKYNKYFKVSSAVL